MICHYVLLAWLGVLLSENRGGRGGAGINTPCKSQPPRPRKSAHGKASELNDIVNFIPMPILSKIETYKNILTLLSERTGTTNHRMDWATCQILVKLVIRGLVLVRLVAHLVYSFAVVVAQARNYPGRFSRPLWDSSIIPIRFGTERFFVVGVYLYVLLMFDGLGNEERVW